MTFYHTWIFIEGKYMKEIVSEMDIIITLFTKEVIRQNKCQMKF